MMQQFPSDEPTVNLLHPDTVLDDRVKLSRASRKRLADKGLKFPLPVGPLTVVMMDPIIHTPDFPVCGDPECICYQYEYEQAGSERKPRRRRKTLVNATYEPVRGDLGMVSRPFQLLR